MFNNKKINTYIFIFLAFCVISSKHIIIYNEELLVALSFFFFVIFVNFYFKDSINSFLDERIFTIKHELENFLNLKKNILNNLYKVLEKSFLSKQIINNLNNFTSLKLKKNTLNSEKYLVNIFYTQIYNKLKNISYSNFNFKNKIQTIISMKLLQLVLYKNLNLNLKNKKNKKNLLNFNYLKKNVHFFSK